MKREMSSVGQWYLRPDTHELFQVVDCDEQSGAVRIQMFDGNLDEIDEDWTFARQGRPDRELASKGS
jgi:hypothetical protein